MLDALLTGIALSMDAVAVSIGLGIAIQHLKPWHVLKPALFFGGFQALMPALGFLAGQTIRAYIVSIDHWVAFGLMAAIGGKMIWDALRGTDDETDADKTLRTGTLLLLAVATSIDALAVGIGLAMTDMPLVATVSIIGAVTFVLSALGVLLGKRLGGLFKKRAALLGGAVLVGLGIKIVVEHFIAGI